MSFRQPMSSFYYSPRQAAKTIIVIIYNRYSENLKHDMINKSYNNLINKSFLDMPVV